MKLLRLISEIRQSSPLETFKRLNDYFWNKIQIGNAHFVHTDDRSLLLKKYGFKGGDIPEWFETLPINKKMELLKDYKTLIDKWHNIIKNRNLDEIRQGPTPEMVDQLDTEIYSVFNSFHPKAYEARNLRTKYLRDYGWTSGGNLKLLEWFKSLPPQKLTELYNEMKRIKKYLDDNA